MMKYYTISGYSLREETPDRMIVEPSSNSSCMGIAAAVVFAVFALCCFAAGNEIALIGVFFLVMLIVTLVIFPLRVRLTVDFGAGRIVHAIDYFVRPRRHRETEFAISPLLEARLVTVLIGKSKAVEIQSEGSYRITLIFKSLQDAQDLVDWITRHLGGRGRPGSKRLGKKRVGQRSGAGR